MKLKKLLYLPVLLAGVLPLQAQNWTALGGGTSHFVRDLYADTIDNLLYAVGSFPYAGDSLVYQVASWNGTAWGKVGNGTGTMGGNILYGLRKFNNDLFVGGMHFMMEGVPNKYLSRWDGSAWQTCGNPNSPVNVNIANNQLFALGSFDSISNQSIKRIARWNGTDWEAFGSPFPVQNGSYLWCTAHYKDEYYFAGNFELGNGQKEIIRWNGNQWLSLQNGINGDWVNAIKVYKNYLFVGGLFYENDGNVADFLMAWDGQQWFDPFPDIQYMSQIKDMEVIDDELYIVGNFIVPGDTGMFAFAHFDGTDFCAFGHADFPYWPDPITIAGLNGNIYVGCNVELLGDTVNYIAQWTGGSMSDTCFSFPLSVTSPEDVFEKGLSIYPNPCSGLFTLEINSKSSNAIEVRIYNLLGELVYSETAKNQTGITKRQIDISGFSKGMYLVQVQTGDNRVSKKVIYR